MDKYLEERIGKLKKSLYKNIQKASKKDVIKDVLDSDNIAKISPDSVAPDKGSVVKKNKDEECECEDKKKCECEEAAPLEKPGMHKSEKVARDILDNFKAISDVYLKKSAGEKTLHPSTNQASQEAINYVKEQRASNQQKRAATDRKKKQISEQLDLRNKKRQEIKDKRVKERQKNADELRNVGIEPKFDPMEANEDKDRCWDGYEPTPGKKAYSKGSCRKKSEKIEKKEKPFHGYNKNKHSKKGGLSKKGREKINRETGSNLKAPVSSKAAKKSPKKAARRKSFCARMSGVKGPTSKKGKLTPKGAALKRWDC